jgi:hypothetical protein
VRPAGGTDHTQPTKFVLYLLPMSGARRTEMKEAPLADEWSDAADAPLADEWSDAADLAADFGKPLADEGRP